MSRAEHLQWCKNRAIEYVKQNDLKMAFASFQSDMTKHPETESHMALKMGSMLLIGGLLSSPKEMTDWIEGVN